MGKFFKGDEFKLGFTRFRFPIFTTYIRPEPEIIPRFAHRRDSERTTQEKLSPDVTKPSSIGKQLQASSKMKYFHKRKAFKKKKIKRKATTT